MTGHVSELQAWLNVRFLLDPLPAVDIEFVVDTGFAGFLTLPEAAVGALGLTYLYNLPAHLADDSERDVSVYKATILWNGSVMEVPVLAMGKRPLLGTLLLKDMEACIQFRDGGIVTAETL